MLLKIVLMEDMFEQLNKSLNENPRLFTIIHGLLMRRVPFDNPWLADEESSIRNHKGLSNAWYWRMGRGSQVSPEEEEEKNKNTFKGTS